MADEQHGDAVDTTEREETPRTVVVTGAAGAVGSQVVRLALARGFQVIGVDRISAKVDASEARYSERIGDLTQRRFCRQAVRGADWVIHTAARNEPGLAYEELEPINVEAVRWLYEAAEDVGATRFVHLSTASLYADRRGVLAEDAELKVASTYAETKEEAERFLRQRKRGELDWVILRPSLVYGPRARAFGTGVLAIPPLLRLFTPYLPSFTGGPRNNWVHAEDVATAALCVAEHPRAVGEIFNVADDMPLSYGEILSATIQAYGLEIGPTMPFPQGLLMSITRFIDTDLVFKAINNAVAPLWQRIQARHGLTGDLRPNVNRALLTYMSGDRVVGCDKLKGLGWEARWPDLREGIAQTVPWYQAERWMPSYKTTTELDDAEGVFGLSYTEQLSGRARWVSAAGEPAQARAMDVELHVTFPNLRQLLARRTAMVEGVLDIEGVAERRLLTGTLEIAAAELMMHYQFAFEDDEGQPYRFVGEKRLSVFRPVTDFAKLSGKIIDARGREVSQVDVSIGLKEGLVRTLTSIRLT